MNFAVVGQKSVNGRKVLTVTFVEEAQQYGGVNEVVVVSRLMAQSLVVYGGDKCQTPGGLNKEAEGADIARQKLISR